MISLMVWTLTIIVTFKYVLFFMQTSFFLGRRTLIGNSNSGLPGWRDNLCIAIAGLGVDPSTTSSFRQTAWLRSGSKFRSEFGSRNKVGEDCSRRASIPHLDMGATK